MKRTIIVRIGLVVLLGLVVWWVKHRQQSGVAATPDPTHQTTPTRPNTPAHTTPTPRNVPDYVLKVWTYVKTHDEAPDGFVGGRVFQNRENRLEKQDPQGKNIRYREWDVRPKVQGQNRGAERLITGSDQSAWYTSDHYKTFVRLE